MVWRTLAQLANGSTSVRKRPRPPGSACGSPPGFNATSPSIHPRPSLGNPCNASPVSLPLAS
jgi:hypothetical protein